MLDKPIYLNVYKNDNPNPKAPTHSWNGFVFKILSYRISNLADDFSNCKHCSPASPLTQKEIAKENFTQMQCHEICQSTPVMPPTRGTYRTPGIRSSTR